MLILERIEHLSASNRLVRFTGTRPGLLEYRQVHFGRELALFLRAPPEEFRTMVARSLAVFETFMTGRTVSFALNPHAKAPGTLIARNAPEGRGVVAFRIKPGRHNEPEIRVFGCFAGKDVIILLRFRKRADIDFASEVEATRREWESLFPFHQPLRGMRHDDYLSQPYSAS